MADLTKELSSFEKTNNTLIKAVKENPKDKIEIEIGDSKQTDFKPQFKVMRWDNEVNFSMRAEEDPTATVDIQNGIVKYIAKNYEVHQYEKPEASEDGGFEFEWVLQQKPSNNVLTATIQTKELDFFYQPAFTPEEIAQGMSRPDNVIGSYAVYHKTKSNNIVGGKEYKTGKFCHIYRPEAIDQKGNKVWCELHIDEGAGLLTVTVPQNYLDTATYPVVVDPTFGYTTIGASEFQIAVNDFGDVVSSRNGDIYTPSESGVLATISVALRSPAFDPVIPWWVTLSQKDGNAADSHSQIAEAQQTINLTSSKQWFNFTMGNESFSASTDYILSSLGDAWSLAVNREARISSDTVTTRPSYNEIYFASFAAAKENPWGIASNNSPNKLSIYATYYTPVAFPWVRA
jgi:hypothetical protein